MIKLFKNRFFISVICVVMALVIGLVAMPLYNNLINKTVNVVVASRDIYPGTKITEDMLKIVEMNAEAIPADAAHSIEEVMFSTREMDSSTGKGVSLYALTTIMKDYYITARQVGERLVSPAERVRAMKSGESVVSISLANVEKPGQLVTNNVVQVMYYNKEKEEFLEIPALRAIEVVCTLAEDGTEITEVNQKSASGETLVATRIQFILNIEQSRILASYSQSTKLAFFLVYSGDNPYETNKLTMRNSI